MIKVCHIVGGGDFFGIRPTGEGDFIIAADKGLLYLQNLGITPNFGHRRFRFPRAHSERAEYYRPALRKERYRYGRGGRRGRDARI